jgi:hypothetical protein
VNMGLLSKVLKPVSGREGRENYAKNAKEDQEKNTKFGYDNSIDLGCNCILILGSFSRSSRSFRALRGRMFCI